MVYEMFAQGGPIMWLLLGCSIAGVALMLERTIFWILESRRVDLGELESFFERIHRGTAWLITIVEPDLPSGSSGPGGTVLVASVVTASGT